MSTQKRIRSRNFTPKEKFFLLDCVKPFIEIIECPETNQKVNKMKDDAWLEIEEAFNLQNETQRDAKSLRCMYQHFKMTVRKEMVQYQKQVAAGEIVEPPELDKCATKLLSMINLKIDSSTNPLDFSFLHTSNTNSLEFDEVSSVSEIVDNPVNYCSVANDEELTEEKYQPPPEFLETLKDPLLETKSVQNHSRIIMKHKKFQSRFKSKRKLTSSFNNRSRSPKTESDDELLQLKKENYVKQNALLDKQIEAAKLDIRIKRRQLENDESQVKALYTIKRLLQQVLVHRRPL